jgi:hypothetical protein
MNIKTFVGSDPISLRRSPKAQNGKPLMRNNFMCLLCLFVAKNGV